MLYLETQADLETIAGRAERCEMTPSNPYWQRNARAFADPDGYQVLLTLAGGAT